MDRASEERGWWGWKWQDTPEDGANGSPNDDLGEDISTHCRVKLHKNQIYGCQTYCFYDGADGYQENTSDCNRLIRWHSATHVLEGALKLRSVIHNVGEQIFFHLYLPEGKEGQGSQQNIPKYFDTSHTSSKASEKLPSTRPLLVLDAAFIQRRTIKPDATKRVSTIITRQLKSQTIDADAKTHNGKVGFIAKHNRFGTRLFTIGQEWWH